jgi:hypothetical protein
MNTPKQNGFNLDPVSGAAEHTLRLIASLPSPAGLEDRVQASLQRARRTSRVLPWPSSARAASGWMRGAAAAAIVFVVAGGGWGVYSRVQKPEAAKLTVIPHPQTSGEFSNAGAMRTPTTLDAPVLAHPMAVPAQAASPAKPPVNAAPAETWKSKTSRESVTQPDRSQSR